MCAASAGVVTISGTEAPAASLATLTLAADHTVSGYSSVNFNGLLLGNPVTGTYELRPDCTLILALQDDSGAFQHFRGTVPNLGGAIAIRQTDAGTGEHGVLSKAVEDCTATSVHNGYSFTLTRITTGRPLPSETGAIRLDPRGQLVPGAACGGACYVRGRVRLYRGI
jgi:hypothetical protein